MSQTNDDNITDTLSKGAIGTFTPVLGVLTSQQESLEHWLRVVALALGCVVSIVTAYSILRKSRK